MAEHREIEWQLAASDLPAVRRWLTEHPTIADLQIEPRDSVDLHDTYLDTDDWRFHRAGFALRARASAGAGEATLKSLSSARNDVADRIEVSEKLPSGDPETMGGIAGDVGRRVRAVTGKEPLRRLFEVHTTRERFRVRRDGADVGEIALDDTLIESAGGRPHARIRRVEVEAHSSRQTQPLEDLVTVLRAECSLEPASDSKYVTGLDAAGLAPPNLAELVGPPSDPSMPVLELARTELRRRLAQWAAHEPGARLGEDPKQLHDLRVAGRRTDATLRLFESYLPRNLVRARQGLKKLLRVLGEARDFDVQLAAFDTLTAELGPDERAGLARVRERMMRDRERARAKMLKQLDSPTGLRWRQKLETYLAGTAPPVGRAQRQPAATVLPDLVRRSHRRLRKAADALTPSSTPQDYHHVRRLSKRLRYALDTCCGIYGDSAEKLMSATRRLQNRLGEQQDAQVAKERLMALAHARSPRLPPSTAFVLGRLAQRYENDALRARDRFGPAWRRVRGKRWKKFRRAMKDAREAAAPTAAGSATPAALSTSQRS